MTCAGVAALTSFSIPIFMGSNLWPIAGAILAAPSVFVAALVGTLCGATTARLGDRASFMAHAIIGIAIALLAALILVD